MGPRQATGSRNGRPEISKKKKGIKQFRVAESENPVEMDAGALYDGPAFDNTIYISSI